MPRRETISLRQPVRDVRLRGGPGPSVSSATLAAAEQTAYERGRADGEKQLREQLLHQRQEMAELQRGLLQSLRDTVPQVARECEGALIALALEIAGKLVADLPITSEMMEATIREALTDVEQNSHLTVLLHPMDFELLQQAQAPLLTDALNGDRLKFQPSPQVTRGGCLIQTQFGVVDARRESKLEALQKSLLA